MLRFSVKFTVPIDLRNHVPNFLLCRVLTEPAQDYVQFLRCDTTITVLVKQRERFSELYNNKKLKNKKELEQ